MDRDNKPLINDPDDGKEKAWVAVEVRSKGDVWKDQAFTQTTSSSTNSRGSEAKVTIQAIHVVKCLVKCLVKHEGKCSFTNSK